MQVGRSWVVGGPSRGTVSWWSLLWSTYSLSWRRGHMGKEGWGARQCWLSRPVAGMHYSHWQQGAGHMLDGCSSLLAVWPRYVLCLRECPSVEAPTSWPAVLCELQLLRRGFPTPEELGVQQTPARPSSSTGGPSSAPPLPPRPSAVASDPGAALGDAVHRWRHVLPNHRQLEYRAQAAAAAATVLYNAAAAAPDINAPQLLDADSLRCWMHVLQVRSLLLLLPSRELVTSLYACLCISTTAGQLLLTLGIHALADSIWPLCCLSPYAKHIPLCRTASVLPNLGC